MAQATFSVRMDESLKRQFDSLCADFGMSVSTAINVFARAVVRERRIPFEISSPTPEVSRESALRAFEELRKASAENGLSDMPLEAINAEISSARRDREVKK